jgi:hypothetical protein
VLPPKEPPPTVGTTRLLLVGNIPREVWNRLGTKVLPKLQVGSDLQIGVDFSVSVGADLVGAMQSELRQILDDLGLGDKVQIRTE